MRKRILISYFLIVAMLSVLYVYLFFEMFEPVPLLAAMIVLTASYFIPVKQIVPSIKQVLYCLTYCSLVFILLSLMLFLLFNLFDNEPGTVNISELARKAMQALIYIAPQIFAALYIGKFIQWVIGMIAAPTMLKSRQAGKP